MTLQELVDGLVKLKGWRVSSKDGASTLTVPVPGERLQDVSLTRFDDRGEPMARFTTLIGGADALEGPRLRAALELNFRIPHGCLAIDGGHLVMTDTRPLQTTTPASSGESIEYLARQADAYEKLIYKTDIH